MLSTKLPTFALISRRIFSSESAKSKTSLFFSADVQKELISLTTVDYGKVFRVARRGQEILTPAYQFVTDQELQEMRRKAAEEARRKLQMPPVMDQRKKVNRVLEEDPALIGYDKVRSCAYIPDQ